MKVYLGIDFGVRFIGLAISDETGTIANPLVTINADATALKAIEKIVIERSVGGIVLGRSINLSMEDNPVQELVNQFKKELESTTAVPVFFEPEHFTSIEAARTQTDKNKVHATAAALILQSFLDKKNNE